MSKPFRDDMAIAFSPKGWTGPVHMRVGFESQYGEIDITEMIDANGHDWWPLLNDKVRRDVVEQLRESIHNQISEIRSGV